MYSNECKFVTKETLQVRYLKCAKLGAQEVCSTIQRDSKRWTQFRASIFPELIHGMWMIYITFERGGPKFSNTTSEC